MKPKLDNMEIINHMKEKGIKFTIMSEKDALSFLNINNYYFKLGAYRKNFEKYQRGECIAKYIDLDFAYLKELSTIDMHIRKIILKMCLDVEHALKVDLVNDISINPKEDGYTLVKDFCSSRVRYLDKIEQHKKSVYTESIYGEYHPEYPIWVFLEIISFSDLIFLLKFYSNRYPGRLYPVDSLFKVVNLRNACAHSNCLINDLNIRKTLPSPKLGLRISKIKDISVNARKNYLRNYIINDFITLIYVFDDIIKSKQIKQYTYNDLEVLFNVRMIKNKDFFDNNKMLKNSYGFVKKVIDNIVSKC